MINQIQFILQIVATGSFLLMGIINLLPGARDYNFAGINLSLFVLYLFLYFHPFGR
jgi:hypothetical protein